MPQHFKNFIYDNNVPLWYSMWLGATFLCECTAFVDWYRVKDIPIGSFIPPSPVTIPQEIAVNERMCFVNLPGKLNIDKDIEMCAGYSMTL